MQNSILKNLSYNVILQIVLMILPLISIPYVSRVLGNEGIGIYSFTLSLTQYFIILGSIGLALYGNRQIAYTRDDKELMSRTFWAILILRVSTTSLALFFYYGLFLNAQDLFYIRMIQSIHIVASMFDITWLYVGLEEFKRIVTRNLLIKMIGLIAIFVFIRSQDDVILYTWINIAMSIGSTLVMWLYVPKLLVKTQVRYKDVQSHFKPALHLFIPQIASQVYVMLDKTMIGYLSSYEQVGFYTQSDRIIKAVQELIATLGTVMLPRMSYIFSKGDTSQMKTYLNQNLKAVSYVSLPMFFGIVAVAPEFVPWFFGPGYEPVILIMQSVASVLFFISLSSVLGVQYLIPSNRVNEFTLSIVLGAIINLVLNFTLIPKFGALGAVIGTISAEFIVMLVQFIVLRKIVTFSTYFRSLIKYILASVLMVIAIRLASQYFPINPLTTMIQVGLGFIIYILLLYLMKEEMNLKVFDILKRTISR